MMVKLLLHILKIKQKLIVLLIIISIFVCNRVTIGWFNLLGMLLFLFCYLIFNFISHLQKHVNCFLLMAIRGGTSSHWCIWVCWIWGVISDLWKFCMIKTVIVALFWGKIPRLLRYFCIIKYFVWVCPQRIVPTAYIVLESALCLSLLIKILLKSLYLTVFQLGQLFLIIARWAIHGMLLQLSTVITRLQTLTLC